LFTLQIKQLKSLKFNLQITRAKFDFITESTQAKPYVKVFTYEKADLGSSSSRKLAATLELQKKQT
jgi:hypothetical protein